MIRQDGGIQWGALLSFNLALSLLIVTTNVVVLCEYLPQEFPLWGLLKVIVLYCTSHCQVAQLIDDLKKRLAMFNIRVPTGPAVRRSTYAHTPEGQLVLKVSHI